MVHGLRKAPSHVVRSRCDPHHRLNSPSRNPRPAERPAAELPTEGVEDFPSCAAATRPHLARGEPDRQLTLLARATVQDLSRAGGARSMKTRRAARGWLTNLAMAAFVTLMSFGLIELALRQWFPMYAVFMERDPRYLYKLVPNSQARHAISRKRRHPGAGDHQFRGETRRVAFRGPGAARHGLRRLVYPRPRHPARRHLRRPVAEVASRDCPCLEP